MATAQRIARGLVTGLVLVGSAAAFVGCSQGSDSSERAVEENHILEAGTVSQSLGVSHWVLDDSGTVEARGASEEPIATYQILPDHGGLVNLENSESKMLIGDSGEVNVDTRTELDKELTEAFRGDLLSASEATADGLSTEGVTAALEWVAYVCCVSNKSGTLYRWWSQGWTPYCAIRSENYFCSGYDQCGALAAVLGCEYMM